MGIKITSGLIHRPQKIVIYGPEGIGKTTFASYFPSPLFLDTEGGTSHIDVVRAEWGSTWEELLETVKEVAVSQQLCETLVIDTADWAEQLCIQYILRSKKLNSIEDPGYGKGYTYVGEEFSKLLTELNKVIDNGIHVVITAHAKMRKFEQPDELGAYDRWEMKLSKQAAPLLKEWADMVLFCNYKTHVVTVDKSGTKKPQGGKRVVYTNHHPCWDAKNRCGLPDEIELDADFKKIQTVLEPILVPPTAAPKAEEKKAPAKKAQKEKPAAPTADPEPVPEQKMSPLERLKLMAQSAGITSQDIQQACEKAKLQPKGTPVSKYSDEFIQTQLLDKWDKFEVFVLKNIKGVPADWLKGEN